MTLRTQPTAISYISAILALLVSSISLLVSAAGEDHSEQTFIQHQSHQHGLVEFNIAQQGKQLLIEIQAPGADLLGFEHAAETEQQQRLLAAALAQLQQPQQLFSLAAGGQCTLQSVAVQHSLAPGAESDQQADSTQAKEHVEHEEQGEHGGFSAQYQFSCNNIIRLTQITSHWFEHFPASEKITVQLITDRTEKSLSLTASQAVIHF